MEICAGIIICNIHTQGTGPSLNGFSTTYNDHQINWWVWNTRLVLPAGYPTANDMSATWQVSGNGSVTTTTSNNTINGHAWWSTSGPPGGMQVPFRVWQAGTNGPINLLAPQQYTPYPWGYQITQD